MTSSTLVALLFACGASSGLDACTAEKPPARAGVLTIAKEQQASWLRNFNPLITTGRWPCIAGIHEPMMVFSSTTGAYVPWLATAVTWEDDNRTLRATLRPGVLWSDGAPFTARDVAFTFDLMRRFKALDQRDVWGFLARVEAPSDHEVLFRFSRTYVPGFHAVVHQSIVPEHVWKDVADPVRFANPNPVGTGPFTEVLTFQNQVFELGKNPHYWQPGKPGVDVLRFPAFPSNDQVTMALMGDDVDWAGTFVPAIDRLYVARDPEHHHYWFPLVGNTVFLYLNTTRAPLSDVRLRRAFSQAIDRDLLVKVAMYDYTRPADGTGLSDALAGYRDPAVATGAPWLRYDPDAAARTLDDAGYRLGSDGVRRDASGAPLRFEIAVVSGWSDWVRAAQVISRGLDAIGVDASVRTLDFSPWFERVQLGTFELAIGWSIEGPTPYPFYRSLMATATKMPVGTVAPQNWNRFASPRADELLAAFEQTADPAEQHRLAAALEAEFSDALPAIPLFPNPSWGTYNDARFTGFPSADDPYAQLSPNPEPECLLVLTRLTPRSP